MSSSHEESRQRALDRYRVVDTLPEGAYDDIVALAASICGTPVALISLLDNDRQWFKARVGLDARETPRDVAFCDHAIRSPDQLMEVVDATRDPRFADNPLVTGEPKIRFYAGVPVVTPGGEAIGTVCVIDREPRQLTDAQRDGLAALGRLTVSLLEGRLREMKLQRAQLDADRAPPPDVRAGYGLAIIESQAYLDLVARSDRDAGQSLMHQLQVLVQELLSPEDVVTHMPETAELVVVLAQASAVEDFPRRLREAVASHPVLGELAVGTATSADGEAMEAVFERADHALKRDKRALRRTPPAAASRLATPVMATT